VQPVAISHGQQYVRIRSGAGSKKSLRVYVRGPRGQQTTQEFPESSTIGGTQYRCRMGNSTFGVDPDPGRIKTLSIYARASNGQRRMFEYREGSTIDGSMFSGWRNGNWGRDPWNGRWNDSDYARRVWDTELRVRRTEFVVDRQ
jgi:hypothetical protein